MKKMMRMMMSGAERRSDSKTHSSGADTESGCSVRGHSAGPCVDAEEFQTGYI